MSIDLSTTPPGVLAGFCTLLGLIVGSFLNVVIARLPEGQNIAYPGSRCPKCEASIRAVDNIPVLSWILLRGRCRNCEASISVKYPIVEAVTGLAFLMVYLQVRPAVHDDGLVFLGLFLHGSIFLALLIAISVIDLELMIIPDELSLGGTLVGLAFAVWVGQELGVPWQHAALGAFVSAFVLWFVAFTYRLVRNREGMGMGDVKLMAFLGAFLGYKSLPFIIFASALQGSLLAIVWLIFAGNEQSEDIDEGSLEPVDHEAQGAEMDHEEDGVGAMAIPFGPFLALAGAEWYFLSDVLLEWNPLLVYAT